MPIVNVPNSFPDISHYELCDFDKFDGKDMITKATEGGSFVDSTLRKNIEGCKRKGINLGVYHFYKCNIDPIVQANHFIKTVGLENLKSFLYEPILDYETTKGQTESDLKNSIPDMIIFMEYMIIMTGRIPIFYSYESLIKYLNLPERFSMHKLWIARYGKEPQSFLPWKEYWAWQYSDGAITSNSWNDNFPGIGRCDANRFKCN